MSYKLNIESEPFEFYSEFDENAETSEAEQADWEWEEEVRDHRHPHFPVPRSRTARHPVSPGRRMHSRYRHLVRDHRLPYRHRDHRWPYRHRWSAGYGSHAWPPYTAFPMYQPYSPWMGSYPAGPVGADAYAGRDERVLWLQEMLSRILGLQLPLDGIMGPEVQNAVRSFQQQQGLPATGIVDSATERALTAATKSTSSGEMEAFDVSEQELLPAGYYEMEEEFPPQCTSTYLGAGPTAVLDRFAFDAPKPGWLSGSALKPFHHPIVQSLAQRVVASWDTRTPMRLVRLVGHTDPVGTNAYNLNLGGRRALEVQNALKAAIEALRPGLSAQITFIPDTEGERCPVGDNRKADGRVRNRRVEVFLRSAQTTTTPARPPLPGTPIWKGCRLTDPFCDPIGITPVPQPPPSPITRRPGQPLPPAPPSPGRQPSIGSRLRKMLDDALGRLPTWLRKPVRNLILNSASEAALSQGLDALGVTGPTKNAALAVWRAIKH
jgi:Putative peptidoglycan binding domain/OmpA family